MDQELVQIIYYIVAGAFAAVFIKFMTGRTGGKLVKRLMALGLMEEKSNTPFILKLFKAEGSCFKGTYKGCQAGYNQGKKAEFTINQSVSSSSSRAFSTDYTAGYEYWADAGSNAPAGSPRLAIVERQYKTLDNTPMPTKEIKTGNPEFDQRFSVHCDDIDWALKVLGPNQQNILMALPVACFFIVGTRVYYSLIFSPSAAMSVVSRKGLKISNSFTDQPEIFLDAVVALAQGVNASSVS